MKVLQLYCSSIALNNSISIIFCKIDLMMSFGLHSQEKKIFQYRDSRSDPRFQMIWTNPRVEFQKIFQLGRPVYHIHVRCIFLFLSKLTTTTSFIFYLLELQSSSFQFRSSLDRLKSFFRLSSFSKDLSVIKYIQTPFRICNFSYQNEFIISRLLEVGC